MNEIEEHFEQVRRRYQEHQTIVKAEENKPLHN